MQLNLAGKNTNMLGCVILHSPARALDHPVSVLPQPCRLLLLGDPQHCTLTSPLITFQGRGHHTSEKVETQENLPGIPDSIPAPTTIASTRVAASLPMATCRLGWGLQSHHLAHPCGPCAGSHHLSPALRGHIHQQASVSLNRLRRALLLSPSMPVVLPAERLSRTTPPPPPTSLTSTSAECPHHHVGAALVGDISYLRAADAVLCPRLDQQERSKDLSVLAGTDESAPGTDAHLLTASSL